MGKTTALKAVIPKHSTVASRATPRPTIRRVRAPIREQHSNLDPDMMLQLIQGQKDLAHSVNQVLSTMSTYQNTQQSHQQQLENLKVDVKEIKEALELNGTGGKAQNTDLELIQIELRKLNLLITGLCEELDETPSSLLSKVTQFFREALALKDIDIDIVHRIGVHVENRVRHVKVKFQREAHRNLVWNSRNRLRENGMAIFINEDLPPATLKKRFLLRTEGKKATAAGKTVRLLGDKLVVDNVTYTLDDNEKLVQLQGRFSGHGRPTARPSHHAPPVPNPRPRPPIPARTTASAAATSSVTIGNSGFNPAAAPFQISRPTGPPSPSWRVPPPKVKKTTPEDISNGQQNMETQN